MTITFFNGGQVVAKKQIILDETAGLNAKHESLGDVLDVGCGDQIYRSALRSKTYCGIDVAVSGRSRMHSDALIFDGLNIPFPDSSFDFVLCTEVLEHAEEPEQLLLEMKRVVRSTGLILLTVPSMWGEHEVPYDFRRYTSFGIMQLANTVALRVVRLEKELPGVAALVRLAMSEVQASHTSQGAKAMALKWLRLTQYVMKCLQINMPRIYLTNVVLLSKQ